MPRYPKIDFLENPILKRIEFVNDAAKRELKGFPDEQRQAAGQQLDMLQRGMAPISFKSMKQTLGTGVMELIEKGDGTEWRVIYIASLPDAIYVISAFNKKTQDTPQPELDKAKLRLTELRQRLKLPRTPKK